MVKPFESQYGVKVQFEGTRDLNAVLTTRLEGGNPPDLAVLPGPGQMAEAARAGRLVPLNSVLELGTTKAQDAQSWIDLGAVDGKVYGVLRKPAFTGRDGDTPDA